VGGALAVLPRPARHRDRAHPRERRGGARGDRARRRPADGRRERGGPGALAGRLRLDRVGARDQALVAFDAGHHLRFVDAAGHDLGAAPLGANLPTLDCRHRAAGAWPYETAGRSAALVASRLPPAFSAQVSVITEDVRGTVSLKLTTPVTFVLGPATDLRAKFVSIASVIAHETLRPGDVVNVSVPGSLAVTGPAPG
jgi:hypothetical protein